MDYRFVNESNANVPSENGKLVRKHRPSSTPSSSLITFRHTTLQRSVQQTYLPDELRLGFEILARSAVSYYVAGRADAALFWNVDNKILTSSLSHALDHNSMSAGYVAHLPSRYGHNSSLDAAVTCLLHGLSEIFKAGQIAASRSCSSMYQRALKKMRVSLKDEVEARSDDTLAAVMILCIFEVSSMMIAPNSELIPSRALPVSR